MEAVSVKLDAKLYEEIRKLARAEGRTIQGQLARMIQAALMIRGAR